MQSSYYLPVVYKTQVVITIYKNLFDQNPLSSAAITNKSKLLKILMSPRTNLLKCLTHSVTKCNLAIDVMEAINVSLFDIKSRETTVRQTILESLFN